MLSQSFVSPWAKQMILKIFSPRVWQLKKHRINMHPLGENYPNMVTLNTW
jgi:hypothetical protein